MNDLSHIRTNIEKIRLAISAAADRAGRDPESITLIAVTKTYPVDFVAAAVHGGITNAGENRVQEAIPKINTLANDLSMSRLKWHLIGHLQSNKAKLAVQNFDMIHSLDSFKLAREIDRHAEACNRTISALIQVNISKEVSKNGIDANAAEELVTQVIENCPHIHLGGFMTIAPLSGIELARPAFKELRDLRDSISRNISHQRFTPTELSMGMSNDFEIAIEEGSTMVRVGSAIFGSRNYPA